MKPLVLDVDGTFLKTDLLVEAFWAGLGRAPLRTLAALRFLRNRARLKQELAQIAQLKVELMPVNPAVLALARKAQEQGREVILASASDQMQVAALARHWGFSPRIFASNGLRNMRARTKASALLQAFGMARFDYAGNSRDDLPVWDMADRAYVVGAVKGAPLEAEALPAGQSPAALARLLRPAELAKNLVVALPALVSQESDYLAAGLAVLAFTALSAAFYIIGDALDLRADRQHPLRVNRPLAAGQASILQAMALAGGLGALALGLGLASGAAELLALFALTALGYSIWAKQDPRPRYAMLAALSLLRLWGGAEAAQVPDTPQLIGVSLAAVILLLTLRVWRERLEARALKRF